MYRRASMAHHRRRGCSGKHPPPPPKEQLEGPYVCPCCGNDCEVYTEDHGGWEEFWGAKVWHEQLTDVSECCGEEPYTLEEWINE